MWLGRLRPIRVYVSERKARVVLSQDGLKGASVRGGSERHNKCPKCPSAIPRDGPHRSEATSYQGLHWFGHVHWQGKQRDEAGAAACFQQILSTSDSQLCTTTPQPICA